jgi:hypothetical protein
MQSRWWIGVLAGVGCLPGTAGAVDLGASLAWHDDADFGIGAWVSSPVDAISENVAGALEFLWFFPDDGTGVDVTYWELNGNLYHDIPVDSDVVAPYAGLGLNIAHGSVSYRDILGNEFDRSDTDVGLNLAGGAAFTGGSIEPFAEFRIELGGGEGFVFTIGAALPLGD